MLVLNLFLFVLANSSPSLLSFPESYSVNSGAQVSTTVLGPEQKMPGGNLQLCQSSPRVAREGWGLRSSHCRAEETSPRRARTGASQGFPRAAAAIRVVSSAYLRLLIFLLAILIPACASSRPVFLMMYSAYKLNKQGDNIQP